MKKGHIREVLSAIFAIALLYFIFHIAGIGCPIKFFTGISCPGCGMTRAYLSLLRLDAGAAFYYHPLFLLPVVWLVAYIFRSKSPKAYKLICSVIVVMFIIVYVIRLFFTDSMVVVFRPQNGFIFRLVHKIFTILT